MLDFHSWLNKPFDEKTQFKVKELVKNPSELKDAFNKNIEFVVVTYTNIHHQYHLL